MGKSGQHADNCSMRFDVFGRCLVVEASGDGWVAYWPGNEGKRRPAGFPVPAELDADGIAAWLDDLLHEYASPQHSRVRRL